jgi:hypothetical protein
MTREAQVTARVIDFNSKLRDKGYRFKDRDPVMDEICRMITDSGLSLKAISDLTANVGSWARVVPGTMKRWLDGRTRKPQNFTVTWVAYVLGFERKWIRVK